VAALRAPGAKAQRKHPLSVLATMAVVGGLFAVAGLPAYAMNSTSDISAAGGNAVLGVQSVQVSKDALATPLARDGYRATTPEQLAEMTRDDVRAQNTADYLASGARAQGDDYPWYYELADYQGGGLSPLNYYYRQCTDFVAWRLNRDAGALDAPYKYVWSNLTPSGGNASQWKSAWDAQGWTSSSTPIVGSVAWFGYSANHVAYVKAVHPDGNVVIEEYNWVPSVYSQRTIPASSVASFLYPPSH
jgi:surface antigen